MGELNIGKVAEKAMPYHFKLAWLNLRRNGRRSMLSVMIIAITVFALISAGGFGLYTYQSLQESTARDIGHITLSVPGYFEKDEEMPLSNGLNNTQTMISEIMNNEAVRAVQPRVYFTGLVSNGNKSAIFTGTGVNDREFSLKGPFLDMREGKTLSDITSSRYNPIEPEVMLGVDLAKNMNVGVGDWITLLSTTSEGALNAFDFKVHGLYSTGVPELDKRQLYIHIQSAQELLLSDKVSTLSVFLNDTARTEAMMDVVDNQINAMALEQAIELTSWQDRAFFYNNVKSLYNLIFGIMGLVMGLVVFVSLFNTMTMSVTERTREIGTLSALGSYRKEIVGGFLREAGLLAVIGSMTGALLSAALSLFFDAGRGQYAATSRL